jgi:hypothetical protein
LPLGQGHKLFSGRRGDQSGLRPIGAQPVKALFTLDRFRGGCRRQSACPSVLSKAPVEGIEPSLVGLTGRRLTVWPHRNVQSGRLDLNQRFRAPATNPIKLRLIGRCPAEYQAFPRPEFQSAQWESNPHFRHGKAVGCHYIMGACLATKLSKIIRAPGRTRTGVAALRVRSLRR